MRTLLERAAALPGVESVAIAGNHPLDPGYTNSFVIIGREAEAKTWPEISTRAVTPGYFQTVGLPLLSGRLLRDSDGTTSAPVVLINEAAARQFFPGRSPLGAQLRYWGMTRTIVGVIGNERFQGLTEPGPIAVYTPLAQAPSSTGVLLIRTSLDPSALAGAAERVIHEIDPALAVFALEPLDATVSRSISQRRFTMVLLGGFAALALLLAAVGIHGLFSYAVANRRREIGIRVALGATARSVLATVLGREARHLVLGALAGLGGAVGLMRLLRQIPFDIQPAGFALTVTFAALMLVVGLAACVWPARRALAIEPMDALRHE
jgi:putative ABC transport system permease protein